MKFEFHWVKMAVTHFVTQVTHVSRHFGVYHRKHKKLSRENCFENVVSDLTKKYPMCPQNYFQKKKQKLKQKQKTKKINCLQSLADSGDKTSSSGSF